MYEWIRLNQFWNQSLVFKPPISAGSDRVFHVRPDQDWRAIFSQISNKPSAINNERSESVVIQEEVQGVEFALGTISFAGEHYLTHLIQYNKKTLGGRKTVYDYVEFIPFHSQKHGKLFQYAQKCLDVLGVRWGATHTEVMLTKDGPRLIEIGARLLGGPTTEFARKATGSSQLDKLVELYTTKKMGQRVYNFKNCVVPVFINSSQKGYIHNLEIFEEAYKLETFFQQYLWVQNGSFVEQTKDYLTSLGIIALSGNRDKVLSDYKKIRELESLLVYD